MSARTTNEDVAESLAQWPCDDLDLRMHMHLGKVIQWEAGAEYTNMNGFAIRQPGRWLLILEIGEIFCVTDFGDPINLDTDVVTSDWHNHPTLLPRKRINPRTILALNEITRRIAEERDFL